MGMNIVNKDRGLRQCLSVCMFHCQPAEWILIKFSIGVGQGRVCTRRWKTEFHFHCHFIVCLVRVVTGLMLQVYVEHESVAVTRQQQSEPIDLDYCLEAFTKEEHLGEDEKYYCSKCREHQLASKKLQIWRLPPILVSNEYAKCLLKTRLQETVTPAEVQTYRYTLDSYWCIPPILLNCWNCSRSASNTTQHT